MESLVEKMKTRDNVPVELIILHKRLLYLVPIRYIFITNMSDKLTIFDALQSIVTKSPK